MHMSHKANLGLVVEVFFSKCPPLFSQPCVVLCCEPHCLTGKRMLVPQRTLHLGKMKTRQFSAQGRRGGGGGGGGGGVRMIQTFGSLRYSPEDQCKIQLI